MLDEHQRALQEDQEAKEARAAARAAKSDKKKRKSTDVVEDDEDVEMEDAEEDQDRKKTQSAKKRRKAVESEGENEKVMLHFSNSVLSFFSLRSHFRWLQTYVFIRQLRAANVIMIATLFDPTAYKNPQDSHKAEAHYT